MAWYKPWDRQGNEARERRQLEQLERRQWEERTQDPYGPNPPQWDESGFPVGPMPRGKYALDYQYEANRRAEARRQALWGDAQNTMRQGLNLFQSYRPGGSAAAASGMYGSRANIYATQAMNTEAPDLLIDWREQIRKQAQEDINEFNRNNQLITGLSAFNFLSGGTPTTPQANAPLPTEGQPSGAAAGATYGGQGGAQAGIGGDQGGGGAMGMAPGSVAGFQGGVAGGLPSVLGGGGSESRAMQAAGGATVDGAYGGGGGAGGGAAGGGGSGSNARSGGGGAVGVGGRGMDQGGGGGLVEFSSPEIAARSMQQAPRSLDMTARIWTNDDLRSQSTALRVSSARSELLDAMAIDMDTGSLSGLSGTELSQRVPNGFATGGGY